MTDMTEAKSTESQPRQGVRATLRPIGHPADIEDARLVCESMLISAFGLAHAVKKPEVCVKAAQAMADLHGLGDDPVPAHEPFIVKWADDDDVKARMAAAAHGAQANKAYLPENMPDDAAEWERATAVALGDEQPPRPETHPPATRAERARQVAAFMAENTEGMGGTFVEPSEDPFDR